MSKCYRPLTTVVISKPGAGSRAVSAVTLNKGSYKITKHSRRETVYSFVCLFEFLSRDMKVNSRFLWQRTLKNWKSGPTEYAFPNALLAILRGSSVPLIFCRSVQNRPVGLCCYFFCSSLNIYLTQKVVYRNEIGVLLNSVFRTLVYLFWASCCVCITFDRYES